MGNTFGERVLALRKALGLTQGEFSERMGLKQAVISNFEKGKNGASDSTSRLICITFGVNETWLLTGKGEMFNNRLEPDGWDLSNEEKEVLYLYNKLLPEIREDVKHYIKKMFELQELRKQSLKVEAVIEPAGLSLVEVPPDTAGPQANTS